MTTAERASADETARVLLTGATGYVGGRLLQALEARGTRVRCLARRPEFLVPRVGPRTRVVGGDCLDPDSLRPALAGIETAYYLVHSMGAGADFAERDRLAARQFGAAAHEAGVSRIVYLGGLGSARDELSAHLRSRHETGDILRASGVPVVEFRAGIVIGSGSLSFELIRALVERLPVMICPRWVATRTQPIGIEDLIAYLVAGADVPAGERGVFEVGAGVAVSYRDIMLEYAGQRGLRRWLISVPLLTPSLSSLWLGLTSPVYARVGRALIGSLKNPTLVLDRRALTTFDVKPMSMERAIQRAIQNEDREYAATRWSDAVSSAGQRPRWGGVRFGTRLVDSRQRVVHAPPEAAFRPVRRIGGAHGWYGVNWLWRVRGWIDLLLGGVGIRRGRRDAERLRPGDAVDFWRVEAYEPDRRLRLAAEMRLPGRAWLELEVTPRPDGTSLVQQTAIFDPVGLTGLAYWYGIYPLHALVFRRMLRGIAVRAERPDAASSAGGGSGAKPPSRHDSGA